MVYPTYLDDADDTVKEYDEAWAAQYGPDTASAYETEFLLGVAPGAVTNGLAPLKIVEIGTTNILMSESGDFGLIATMMGYSGEYLPCRRIVLASDVTELWQSEWGDARELCNGYLVLRITDDLSLPKSAWQAIGWFAQLEDGRAVVLYPEIFKDPVCRYFENLGGKPVSGLFLSVCIETAPVENTFFINELIPQQ